jgi:hypothetical protein
MKVTLFSVLILMGCLSSSPLIAQESVAEADALDEELAEPDPEDESVESDSSVRPVQGPPTLHNSHVSFEGKIGFVPSRADSSEPKLTDDIRGLRYSSLDVQLDYRSNGLNAQTKFDLRLHELSYFELSRSFLDNFLFFTVGKIRIAQGGNEYAFQSIHDLFVSPYVEQLTPFARSSPAFELKLAAESAGTLRVQMIQDVIRRELDGPGYYTTEQIQPAFAFDWHIVFGKVTPRIQFGSYDSNHSNYKTMGIRVANKHVTANYDYIQDLRFRVDRTSNTSSINRVQSMNLSFDLKAHPYLILKGKFSDLGVIQGEGDVFGNPPPVNGYVLVTDNATVWSVGLESPLPEWKLFPSVHYRETKLRYLNENTSNLNDTKDLKVTEYFAGLILTL